jgi:hypothetical protein
LQTSHIRKLCEVPGAVPAAPTPPSPAHRPTFHGEEPLNQLAEYYKINQDQAKSSFRASVFAIIVGLVTIVAGAWIFYLGRSPNLKLTAISTLAGVLSEFIGGAYFVLFNKTSDQSNYLHDRLVKTQDTMLAVSLCGNIEDSSARNDATRDIIATLLERSATAHRGPMSKKVTRIRGRKSASPNSEQKSSMSCS